MQGQIHEKGADQELQHDYGDKNSNGEIERHAGELDRRDQRRTQQRIEPCQGDRGP